MWENILVGIIVLVSALLVGRKVLRQLKGDSSGCGCAGGCTSSKASKGCCDKPGGAGQGPGNNC